MKKNHVFFLSNIQNEAQIAATYKKFISMPVKQKKQPISDFFLSFASNNHSETNEGLKTENRISCNNSQETNEKNQITLISRQSINSLQRSKGERPNFCVSKDAAEYQEVPFRNTNKEYELFRKSFEDKVVANSGIPKYEKKNKIKEIIENEYNFNKYGEESVPRRKSSIRSNSKGRTPRASNHNINSPKNPNDEFPFNMKNKITFSFQKNSEIVEANEPKRPKKDKFFFENIKEKYFLKIKKVFNENTLIESEKLAQDEIAKVLKDFKEYIDQAQEEK